ncbi:MAG: TrkA family potassium uptake protein [Armatimonadota bacterium]
MKVVIAGCGRVGSTLATVLSREGHNVTIIDINPSSFRRLFPDYAGKKIVGNCTDEETLLKADIDMADVYIAVTNGDNRNLMSVQLAKVRFQVPKVITRLYDPIRAKAYEDLGVETICSTSIISGLMYDMLLDKPHDKADTYFSFGVFDMEDNEIG